MGQFSELAIAIQESEQFSLKLRNCRCDLARARMLLSTAKQLVHEERSEINQLRAELLEQSQTSSLAEKLAEENELLRQQLWELSSVRSRQLGLEPRQPLRVFPADCELQDIPC